MDRLNILGVVVSPSSSDAFGLDMVGHNLVVIPEGYAADCTLAVLFADFSVQQLPHLCRRTDFAISPGVMRVFDALNAKLKSALSPSLLATAARE